MYYKNSYHKVFLEAYPELARVSKYGYATIPVGCCIHHKDLDHYNDDLDNLQLMTTAEHRRLHGKGKTAWNK